MPYPPCFKSQADYDAYRSRLRANGPTGASFCWDCTARYQAQMIEEERCERPDTVFVPLVDEDGETEIVGVRQ